MKQSVFVLAMAAVFFAASAFTSMENADKKYLGSNACKACHNTDKQGKQFTKWAASAHAQAFKTLQKPEADAIAQKAGHKTKAAETPECLTCHVTGKDEKAAQYDAKFTNDEGVGCESCHGAGSGYKTLHMKPENKEKAVAAGLVIPKVADGSAEKQCKQCHNTKSPTYKAFKFKEMWDKIAHPRPA